MIISVKPRKPEITGQYRGIPIYNHILMKVNSSYVLIPALFNSGDLIDVGNKKIEIFRKNGIIAKVKYKNSTKIISVRDSIYSFKVSGMWTYNMFYPSVKFLLLYFSRAFSMDFKEFDKMFNTSFSKHKDEILSIMESADFSYFEVVGKNTLILNNMTLIISDDWRVQILIDV